MQHELGAVAEKARQSHHKQKKEEGMYSYIMSYSKMEVE